MYVSLTLGPAPRAQEAGGSITGFDPAVAAESERRAFDALYSLVGRLRPATAVTLLTEAAEQGSATAMAQLGTMYLDGQGVTQDAEEGLRLLRAAAERGSAYGQSMLGRIYLVGNVVPADSAQARMWLEAAANQEDPLAMFILAGMYGAGVDVEADDDLGFKLLSRSAALGGNLAKVRLGIMLFTSPDRQDPERAVFLLEQVADEDPEAARTLGYQYLTGRLIEMDSAKAVRFISKAADAGDEQAQLMLADLAERGIGMERDPLRARRLREPIIAAYSPGEKNDLAWRYSVSPDDAFRNGPLAVEIMESLLASDEMDSASRLDTLAAAYAEVGRFEDAVRAQEAAIENLAGRESPNTAGVAVVERMLADFRARLDGYRSGQPYRLSY